MYLGIESQEVSQQGFVVLSCRIQGSVFQLICDWTPKMFFVVVPALHTQCKTPRNGLINVGWVDGWLGGWMDGTKERNGKGMKS